MNYQHIPVLLNEAVEGLNVKKDGKYIDCNLGGGGHTAKILEHDGSVLALDIDKSAIEYCKDKFSSEIRSGKLKIFKSNFKDIKKVAKEARWKESEIDGILYDLGLSTFQIKQSARGFSFEDQTEIDMRMDEELGVRAIDLLIVLSEDELASIIMDYGDEPQAKIFAKAIKKLVKQKNGKVTAFELAEVIRSSSKYRVSRLHPATRVFQALRIAVNSELSNFESSVQDAADLLKTGGRLAIITFHSLEDKIAKSLKSRSDLKYMLKEPIVASQEEVERNSSSRSAKLRIYEKI
jgi:16S rRNA (cytosine1402-N4)-methyltransferase